MEVSSRCFRLHLVCPRLQRRATAARSAKSLCRQRYRRPSAKYGTPCGHGRMQNRGAASSLGLNLATGPSEYFQALCSIGGTISRIHTSRRPQHHAHMRAVREVCFSCLKNAREKRVTPLSRRLGKDIRGAGNRGQRRVALRATAVNWPITKLRFPNRKTRPSVKTVITMGLRTKCTGRKPVPGGGRVFGPNPPVPVPPRRD